MRRHRLTGRFPGPRSALYVIACAVPVALLGVALAIVFGSGANWSETRFLGLTPPALSAGQMIAHHGAMALQMRSLHARAQSATQLNSRLAAAFRRDLMIGLGGLYLILLALTAVAGSRLRREAARNADLANNDALTGLPNRISFTREAGEALARAGRDGATAAVALIDLDRFRHVNDTLGHRNGDALLRELAARLTAEVAGDGIVARLGGDEFGLVLSDGAQAPATLRRVRAALDSELPVAGLSLHAPASIGYVLVPDDGADVDTLLARADIALYAAKDGRRGLTRYDASLDGVDAAGLGLVAELRRAIDDDQLVLHYQPQLHLDSDRVVALEALVRWQHPVHGLLFPDRFLPLAEQTDEIEQLTGWVLRRALRDLGGFGGDGDRPRVAVNVSARSLGRGDLADEVLAALAETGVAPDRLIVEVTETAILLDPARAAGELARLAGAGVQVSLDDFGRGQTSLGHFSSLPLHELKIDRCFVGDMDVDPTHAAIVRALVELGRNLGLQVVAEGVETETVRRLLHEAGTDVIQGYLMSRPLPLGEVVAWLTAHGRSKRPASPQGVTEKTTLAR